MIEVLVLVLVVLVLVVKVMLTEGEIQPAADVLGFGGKPRQGWHFSFIY